MKKRARRPLNRVNCVYLPPIFLFLILLVIPGCTKKETPRKVSLYKKTGETAKEPVLPQLNTLWFGFDLSLGPKDELLIYTPFLKYLEKKTGKRFRIKFTGRYEDTVEKLGTGETHFAAIGTLNYVIGAEKYGIKYLVSSVNRDGDPRYHSIIVTKQDSDIQTIHDLRGKCFAFGSIMSTQGHLIPRKMLEDEGIGLDDLSKHIYTDSHINAAKSVLNGECDAAGIQDTLAQRLISEGKVRAIKVSKPYPSSLIAYNKNLDSVIVDRVRSALIDFEPSGKHREMLYEWDKTDMPLGFTEIDELELNKVKKLAVQYGLVTE